MVARSEQTNDAVTDIKLFIEGFLKGMVQDGERDFDDVLKCIDEIISKDTYEKIWNDIVSAVNELKHVDIAHWDSIQKALLKIFNSVYEIIAIIKPCVSSIKEIQSFISLLESLNPAALLIKAGKNIIFHGGKLLSDLIDLYNSLQKGDWEKMGYDVADFLYNLLLKSPAAKLQLEYGLDCTSKGCLIFKGILEGIAAQDYDVSQLLDCIESGFDTLETDFDEMISELREIIQKLKLKEIFKVIHALKYVFDDLKNMFDAIEQCATAIDDNVKKIIEIFESMDIAKLVEKFALNLIKHFGSVFTDVTSAISNYDAGSYEACGKNIGNALYEVFIS